MTPGVTRRTAHGPVTGDGMTVTMPGATRLLAEVQVAGADSSVTAPSIRSLAVAGAVALTRADRLVLTGDRNTVTVARGRSTLHDRGVDNVLGLRPRRS